MVEGLTPNEHELRSREVMPPPSPETPVQQGGQELSEGQKALKAVEWLKDTGVASKEQIANMRRQMMGAAELPDERWGKYVGQVSRERSINPVERIVGKNLDKPMFTKGEFVAGKGGRNFEISDPIPDAQGLIKVRELSLDGGGIKWTEKAMLEAELFEDRPQA